MDHAPNSDTFQKHYLSRFVCADLWAINRAQQPQQDLIKQATSHGSSRDSRRPIALTRQQSLSLQSDARYVQITQQLRGLRKGAPERAEIRNKRKALLARLRKEAMDKIRAEWNRKQATVDIDHQMEGGMLAPITRASDPTSPAQQRMLDALQAPLVNDMNGTLNYTSCVGLSDLPLLGF